MSAGSSIAVADEKKVENDQLNEMQMLIMWRLYALEVEDISEVDYESGNTNDSEQLIWSF
jgi:hypothetical protein